MNLKLIVISACTLGCALLAQAIPTGLNIMPTADVMPFGMSRYQYEFNSEKANVPDRGAIVGTQTGIGLGTAEGGIDEVSHIGTVYNLKMLLLQGDEMMPAIAVGVENIGRDAKPQYYLVASKLLINSAETDTRSAVHAGFLLDTDGKTRAMYGADLATGPLLFKLDQVGLAPGNVHTAFGVGLKYGELSATVTSYDIYKNPGILSYTIGYTYVSQ
ncbi:MAG: hypothetical protein WCJ56_06240 [bacterium]